VTPGGPEATGTCLSTPIHPNDLWCTDYKEPWAMARNGASMPYGSCDRATEMIIP
jgi:hypothetical protein